jgi:hypothetical protein
MIAALEVDEQRPSSDLCGEILALNTSIKGTGQEKATYLQAASLRQRVVGAHRGAVGEAPGAPCPGVPRTFMAVGGVCATWDVQGEPRWHMAHAPASTK